MEEKEQFRKEMMQRLIPERDTNVQTQASGKQSQKNQGRPAVAQTRTSGLRNQTSGVEAKVNTGLRKPTWQKENTAIKTSVSIFLLWLKQRNQEYMSTGRHQFIIFRVYLLLHRNRRNTLPQPTRLTHTSTEYMGRVSHSLHAVLRGTHN